MNSILTYDRTILIYAGEATENALFRGEFSFSEEKITRDLTQRTASELTIYDADNIVKALDLVYIPNHLGLTIIGRIDKVVTEKDSPVKKKISFFFGADTYTNERYLPNNSLVPNFTENNHQTLDLTINTTPAVTTSNNFLDCDTLCRQAMRAGPCKESMTHTSSRMYVDITDNEQGIMQFSIDDTDLSNKVITFADDKYNTLRLYNQEDKSLSATYYLADDGSVSDDIAFAQYPIIEQYEVVEADKYNDINFAKSRIKQQEYNNNISFDVPLTTNIKALAFDDTFLGRKVRVWFSDATKIDTLISKYSINSNTSLSVSLGLTRTKLTEQLKKEG